MVKPIGVRSLVSDCCNFLITLEKILWTLIFNSNFFYFYDICKIIKIDVVNKKVNIKIGGRHYLLNYKFT